MLKYLQYGVQNITKTHECKNQCKTKDSREAWEGGELIDDALCGNHVFHVTLNS